MASQDTRRFSSTSPHFFAIILQQTLPNNRLKIPNKIVRKCGSSFGDDVSLKLPCGSEWKLGLTKTSEGRVYIEKGWVEFSKHYSIGKGHFLSLRYDGNSRFNAVIFDTTTTEIDYPLKNRNETETQNRENPVKEEEEIENENKRTQKGHFSGEFCDLGGEDGNSQCSEGLASRNSSSKSKHEGDFNGDDDEDYNPSLSRKRRKKCRFKSEARDLGGEGANSRRSESLGSPNSSSKEKRKGTTSTSNATSPRLCLDEKALALNRASGFRSDHPFFLHVIQPSSLSAPYCLNVPCSFARSHLGANTQIVLKDPDQRTWCVEYKTTTVLRIITRPRFSTGWLWFARENGLKIGDVCAFVLTKTVPTVTFEVLFLEKNGVNNSASVQESVHVAKRKVSGLDGRFQSEKPSFAIYMLNSYINKGCHLRIPVNFARSYMGKNQCEIRLYVSDGRSWSVQYRIFQSNSTRFEISNGWSEFKQEIGLAEADICTFELTNKAEMSFEVRILKPNHEGYEQIRKDLQSSRTIPLQTKMLSKARTNTKLPGKFGEVKSEATNQFRPENPYFRMDFPSSHYKKQLNIPGTFGRCYLEKKSQIVTLQVGEKSWPVKIIFSLPAKYSFNGGWIKFWTENSLRVGDFCVFELIQTNQVVLKVSIFRKSC